MSTRPTISTTITSRRGMLTLTIEMPVQEALAAADDLGFYVVDHVESEFVYELRKYMSMLRSVKESGTVKWFDDKKGYGFILTTRGDLFVHWRGIVGDGYRSLIAGQMVRFFRRPGVTDDGGEEAVDVEVVTPAAAATPSRSEATAI